MGKLIASYGVRIHLREPDDLAEGETVAPTPGLKDMSAAVAGSVASALWGETQPPLRLPRVTVTAERIDK